MLSYKTLLNYAGILIITFSYANTVHAESSVMAYDAWSPSAPPMSRVRAAYLTLENISSERRCVVKVSSPSFNNISIHKSIEEDGIASMESLSHLEINAGGSVKLSPGGLHLMLMNPSSPDKLTQFTLRLKLDNDEEIEIIAHVKSHSEMFSVMNQ